MANTDEDWKKFLNATQEDDEEVETDKEDEPDAPDGDEKPNPDDSEEDDGEEGSDENESDEDDDSEEDKDGKKKFAKDTYKPRLKQFLNDDGSFSAEKAEKAYTESSKQGVKLNAQLKDLNTQFETVRSNYGALLDAIKAKPDIAKALFGEEGAKKLASSQSSSNTDQQPSDPLLRHVKAQMDRVSKQEYDEFVDAHPEAVTDPERARLIGEFMEEHGATYRRQHNGEIPSMKESLEKAYRYYGWDLEDKKKEDVASAAKKAAATRSSGTAKRPATKKEATMGEEFFAAKLGVKLKKK